ncbi:hypothetical protein ACX0HA_10700 [Flavobacterium hauense]
MEDIKNFNIGNFIKINHIERALELVKLQIEGDKFSFKTIELEIYRIEDKLSTFDVNNYYKEFIAKDIFYNKTNIFYNIEYLIPKGTYGVRNFNFLSFEMLILYYSLSFYFYDIIKDSYEAIEDKKNNRDNISTYYGGKIDFNNPNKSNLFYQNDYIDFNNVVNTKIEEILRQKKKAIIIKLDIQDYFKSIDFNILIETIKKYAVPSNSKRLNFDYTTIEEIKNLFLFINKSLLGVPLFSQSIVSNYLSYLYLFNLDNYIQELSIANEKDFLYTRYVDDFYLIYKRNKTVKNDIIGDEIFNITTGITEFLFSELQLNINHLKTHKVILENTADFEKFIKKEKIISIPETLKKPKKPQEKLDEIKDIIEKLKSEYKSDGLTHLNIEDNNKLKEIFSKSLTNYIKVSTVKANIDKMFKGWNPILTLYSSQALIYLLKHSKENKTLKEFLLTNTDVKFNHPQYLYLLEKFILSNDEDLDFNTEILSSKIKNPYLTLIKKMLGDKSPLTYNQDIWIDDVFITENQTITQQIKMLNLAEIEERYNLAFSHLLNIYHVYCFKNDSDAGELKKYNKTNVENFLDKLNLSNIHLAFTVQFFDRRNKNNISHAGEELMENWIVNENEYFEFKTKLNVLLVKIKKLLPPPPKEFLF